MAMTTPEEHSGFCISSVKSFNSRKVDIPAVENFDFSEALESIYPLLEIVFSFLNFSELKTASKVKKSWKCVADKVLQKRIKPSWITCCKINHVSNIVKYSENLNYNNVGLGIILYDSRRIKLNKFICLHTNTSELSRKTVVEYFSDEVIPQSVDYCLISCPKVNSFFEPLTKDSKNVGLGSIFDGIFIPVIPNVRTTMFHCNPVKKVTLEKTLRTYVRGNEEVKCLLLFCISDLHNSIYNLFDILLPGLLEPQSMAVGGGIIRGTKTFQQVNPQKKMGSSNDTFCIAFLQEKYVNSSFNSYSFVINGDDLSKNEFELELIKFKNRTVLRTYTVGFRICCSAKMDTEDELVLFNKVFPSIPLLSFEADGEIGWNCLSSNQENDGEGTGESQSKRAKHRYPSVQHQWSTVVVLLTWGQLRNNKSSKE